MKTNKKYNHALWGLLIITTMTLEIFLTCLYINQTKNRSSHNPPPVQKPQGISYLGDEVATLSKNPKLSFETILNSSSSWQTFRSKNGFRFDYPSELQLVMEQRVFERRPHPILLVDASPLFIIGTIGSRQDYDPVKHELKIPEGVYRELGTDSECTAP